MNKIKKIINFVIIIFVLLIQINTYAVENETIEESNGPLIELTSCESHLGDIVDVKLNVSYKEMITAGGVIIYYSNDIEDIECLESSNYIIVSDIDTENKKIIVTFTNKNEIKTDDDNSEICTLRFKIPQNADYKKVRFSIENINDLYSDTNYLSTFMFKNSEIDIVPKKYTKQIIIFSSCMLVVIFTILIINFVKRVKQ